MQKNKSLLYVIYFSQFVASFSFFGLISIFILILVHNIGFPEKIAYLIFGNFVALNYICEFMGGFLGGTYLFFERACLIGFCILVVGTGILTIFKDTTHIFLSFPWAIGLSLVTCGNGLLEPNIRNLLGQYYKESTETERDNGFTRLHVFNLIGQTTGIIAMPYLNLLNTKFIFLSSFIFSLAGLINMFFYLRKYKKTLRDQDNQLIKNNSFLIKKGILYILLLFMIVLFTMIKLKAKFILSLTLMGIGICFFYSLISQVKIYRIKIIAMAIILFGLTATEICFRQIMGTITLFTDKYVDRAIMHISIPTAVFESIDPIFIFMLFVPMFIVRKKLEKKGIDPSSGALMSVGLLLVSLAFLLLSISSNFSGLKINMIWLVSFYGVLAIAELLLIPISMAAIAAIAPLKWRGIMMGIYAVTASFSSYIDSWIGELISPSQGDPSLHTYHYLFQNMAKFAFCGAVILLFFGKLFT